MPELPEVETISRQLDQVLPGRKVVGVEVRRDKSFSGEKSELIGKTIDKVSRRSKMTVISFKNWDHFLVVHLKMTGQLIYHSDSKRVMGGHPSPDWVNELPGKYTRIIIDLDNGAKLFFNDLRVFGWIRIFSEEKWNKVIDKLPPDVTSKDFNLDYFKKVVGKSGRSIKLVLMDQDKIGGVGNIYANDALYLAKIDPRRKSNDLNNNETAELFQATIKVINDGIKYGGSSVDKYVDAMGVGGNYQGHFLVYKQDGKKCKRDGEIIKKIKIGARGTYYCPGCQK